VATLALGIAMLVFDFGAVLYGINYLAPAPGDHARSLARPDDGHDALLHGRGGTDWIADGRPLATAIGLRATFCSSSAPLGLALAIGAMTVSPFRQSSDLAGNGGRVMSPKKAHKKKGRIAPPFPVG
jgi:hypothetical protein